MDEKLLKKRHLSIRVNIRDGLFSDYVAKHRLHVVVLSFQIIEPIVAVILQVGHEQIIVVVFFDQLLRRCWKILAVNNRFPSVIPMKAENGQFFGRK